MSPGRRQVIKTLLHRLSQLLVLPLALPCWIEAALTSGRGELVFHTCAHSVALFPGLPGAFLRRAFYTLTLESCSAHCHVGFGSLFSHRQACVGEHVYIGSYALLGSTTLEDRVLVGSRVSILSGHALHVLDDDGQWSPYSPERLQRVVIGRNTWIGEAAVIAANVGANGMVGAGAVVTTEIRDGVVVAGNPARFVRRLDEHDSED